MKTRQNKMAAVDRLWVSGNFVQLMEILWCKLRLWQFNNAKATRCGAEHPLATNSVCMACIQGTLAGVNTDYSLSGTKAYLLPVPQPQGSDLPVEKGEIMLQCSVWMSMCLTLVSFAFPMNAQQLAVVSPSTTVPPIVNLSGVLSDVNGKPLTDVVGVTFYLYRDSQGGPPLWMETQNVHPDETGHYSVILGSTTGQGLPTALFASGEAHWLAAQAQGQPEQPRILLLSVPYALKASDADTLGGFPASAFIKGNASNSRSRRSPFNYAGSNQAKRSTFVAYSHYPGRDSRHDTGILRHERNYEFPAAIQRQLFNSCCSQFDRQFGE